MHHVCGGVRACDGATAIEVDIGVHISADNQGSLSQTALVDDKILDRLLHIIHFEYGAIVRDDFTLIGELAASLRVERRAVENDFDIRRTGHRGNRTLAFLHDAQHLGSA